MLRPKTYTIFVDALENGIETGWRRAHKHTDTPTDAEIRSQIYRGVLDAVCEVFYFDEVAGEGL